MPVPGRKPGDIHRMNILNRVPVQFDPSSTGDHNQILTRWMSIPRRARARPQEVSKALRSFGALDQIDDDPPRLAVQ
jgi:hypothetical protein